MKTTITSADVRGIKLASAIAFVNVGADDQDIGREDTTEWQGVTDADKIAWRCNYAAFPRDCLTALRKFAGLPVHISVCALTDTQIDTIAKELGDRLARDHGLHNYREDVTALVWDVISGTPFDAAGRVTITPIGDSNS